MSVISELASPSTHSVLSAPILGFDLSSFEKDQTPLANNLGGYFRNRSTSIQNLRVLEGIKFSEVQQESGFLSFEQLLKMVPLASNHQFFGFLELEGTATKFPVKVVFVQSAHNKQKIDILLGNEWPRLVFEVDTTLKVENSQFQIVTNGNSPLAGILFTRFFWFLTQSNGLKLITNEGIIILEGSIDPVHNSIRDKVLRLGRFFRKAFFIEKALNTTLKLPKSINLTHILALDTLFRLIINKVVFIEANTIQSTAQLPLLIDVSKFQGKKTENLAFESLGIWLFDQKLSNIRILTTVFSAQIENLKKLNKAIKTKKKSCPICLRSNLGLGMQHLRDTTDFKPILDQLFAELLAEEPEELAQLLLSPMMGKITGAEAMESAMFSLCEKIDCPVAIHKPRKQQADDVDLWLVPYSIKEVQDCGGKLQPSLCVRRDTGHLYSQPKSSNFETELSKLDLATKKSIERLEWILNRTWLKKNRSDYLGKWVAIQEGELVAVGDSFSAVKEESLQKGFKRCFITLVEPLQDPFAKNEAGLIPPKKVGYDKLIAKIKDWESEEGTEQQETLNYLKRELDRDRAEGEKLFS
ncbi:MAG: hypothetical protein HY774_07970 [Acidobacteria bacterium]|nr:hypothetical protein [Acidobacteriota bacterium]